MSVPSVQIAGHGYNPQIRAAMAVPMRTVKLGMKPSRPTAKALFIDDYTFELASKAPPEEFDLSPSAISAIRDVKGNDEEGCCTIADMGNGIGLWTGNDKDSGGLVSMSRDECLRVYHDIGGPGDNGLYMPDVKNYGIRTGFLAGGKRFKLDAWVNARPSEVDSIKAAIIAFGGLSIGFMVPSEWMGNQTYEGAVWDTPRRLSFVGGHAVRLVGWNRTGFKLATWGLVVTMTYGAFRDSRIVTEGYVELAPAWYNSDKIGGTGINVDRLKSDLAPVSGGQVIDWEPDPAPTPPPPPPPPAPPKSLYAQVAPVTVPFEVSAFGGLLSLKGTAVIPGQNAPVVEASSVPVGFGFLDVITLGKYAWAIWQALRKDQELIQAVNNFLVFLGLEPLPPLTRLTGVDLAAISYWSIVADLVAIANAVATKNVVELPALISKLLTDLGFTLPW